MTIYYIFYGYIYRYIISTGFYQGLKWQAQAVYYNFRRDKNTKLLINEVFITIINWFLKVTCLMFRFTPHFGEIVLPNVNIWTSKNWFLSNLSFDSQTNVWANGKYINKLTGHGNKTYTHIIVCLKVCI